MNNPESNRPKGEASRRVSRRQFLFHASALTTGIVIAVAETKTGFIEETFNGLLGKDSKKNNEVTPAPTAKPTETATATPTVEATLKPEIKSTPYKFINPRTYLDGKLTLEVTDDLPTRTTVPTSIVTGAPEGKSPATASSGIEINPNMPSAAKDVVDVIDAGLLLAWSTQTNIPNSQKDLVTTEDESRDVQMAKWAKLQARAKNGEKFPVTLKAYKDDGFVAENVTMDIGDNYSLKLDEVAQPPVEIIWQSNMGSGLRISPDNKTFRVEFYDQYAGALGLFSQNVFISSVLVQTMAYLPELVVEDGKQLRPDYGKPGIDYQANILRNKMLTLLRKYNIIPDANPGTYGKDWKDSSIHPLP